MLYITLCALKFRIGIFFSEFLVGDVLTSFPKNHENQYYAIIIKITIPVIHANGTGAVKIIR